MKDLAYDLASNAAWIKYDNLPSDVVEVTKKFILDTLGVAIAGSGAPGCKSVVEHIKDWGGKEESTILVYGGKVISSNAAFANSMMAHALDFDDTQDEATLHANVSVLPAALAMAEREGNVSGKDLITAVAIGVDLVIRLGLGAAGPLSWILSSTAGYFGATIAGGKILGLDKSKLHNAMGIAFSQCAGSAQCLADGALVKRMQPGFAAKAGVLSSLLAQKGITGAKNIFEGQYGFFPLYYPDRKCDRDIVVEKLGGGFFGVSLSIKLYPCCRYTHAAIDATLDLVQENDIKAEEVNEVTVHVTKEAYDFVGKPFEIRENPQIDAQFSIAYTVSVAIAKRKVFIDDFSEQKVRTDGQVLQLATKVKVIIDQEPIAKGLTPCIVDIRTKDKKTYSQRVEILRGNPRKPVSIEEVAQKFRNCAKFSAKPVLEENIEQTIELITKLENVGDVTKIVKLLT